MKDGNQVINQGKKLLVSTCVCPSAPTAQSFPAEQPCSGRPPPPAAVADPPACPVHQRPRSKRTDVKEGGKKFLMLINNFQLII